MNSLLGNIYINQAKSPSLVGTSKFPLADFKNENKPDREYTLGECDES
jgi:hypothetical protein